MNVIFLATHPAPALTRMSAAQWNQGTRFPSAAARPDVALENEFKCKKEETPTNSSFPSADSGDTCAVGDGRSQSPGPWRRLSLELREEASPIKLFPRGLKSNVY